MSALSLVILGLLTAVPSASCQQGLGNLQPWMQGLIAVVVFLVLVAIAFAVNHFWCQEEPLRQNTKADLGQLLSFIWDPLKSEEPVGFPRKNEQQ
ncbi:PDZK1-interacting protein 1 isoform X2 [Phyllostomus discolor]|uniref:PDZK1-interacting protein 1 n=1 Tax=Phyllostomus discolor TaxID=89673 RepID=A0A7E6DRX6_9CHIR|nr:PDZK1-interacting protein 1 isoform X2 [Phyllostomus discolor]